MDSSNIYRLHRIGKPKTYIYIHKYIFTHMLDSVQLHPETHVIVVGLLLRMV